jgi:hypothetical protein
MARTAATTAVVVGTAGAVQHKQAEKYANKQAAQQSQLDQAYAQGAADAQAQQQAAPVPPPAPAQDDLTAKLQQLAELRSAGMLSDEEFAAAKQKLLAS